MTDRDHAHDRKLLLGCASLGLLMAIGLVGILALAVRQDRQAGRYPGSRPIASHSNYKGLPFEYRWDDTYLTTDNFTAVYNWYSVTFDLGAEVRALEKCTLLEGTGARLVAKRHVSVSLCNTPNGQMIFVTRSTTLNGRTRVLTGANDLQSFFSLRPRLGGR